MKNALRDKEPDLKNLTVEEFTSPCEVFASPDDSLQDIEKIMNQRDIRHLPVLNGEKKVIGVISERDVYYGCRLNPDGNVPVKEVMKTEPYCVPHSARISEVALAMSANKYGSAIVTSEDGSLGIFTSTDALNALVEVVRGDFSRS